MGKVVDWLLKGIERDAMQYAEEVKASRGEVPFSGEIATRSDDIYGQYWGARMYNPDTLASKKGGLKIYTEMRQDDQVKAALHLKKSAIVHPGWKIECEDEELQAFTDEILREMDGTVQDTLRSILSAYEYGFSVHEKVYRMIEEGDFKGKIGIKALRPKSPTRFDFEVDVYGNIKPNGLVQRQNQGGYVNLPLEKFALFSYRKEFDNHYGESDLRAAYRFWFLKVNFFRYWGLYLERFGVPVTIGKSAKATLKPADQERFKQIVANIQAGMAAVLPMDLEVEFKEAAATRGETFSKAVDACDIRIARAILVPQLVGLAPQGDTGSLARANVEADTFDLVLGGDSRALEDIVNEQVLKPIVRMNFGTVEEFPRFILNPMREEDRKAFVESWSTAVTAQAATSTQETEAHVRDLLKFPAITEEEQARIDEKEEAAEAAREALVAGAGGRPDPGARGKGNGKGAPGESATGQRGAKSDGMMAGKPKMYVLTTMNAQEARVSWKENIGELDGVELEAMEVLSEAFEGPIRALVVDAGKK
jgi:phage gp29-like protein